jgi:hypothetical protein
MERSEVLKARSSSVLALWIDIGVLFERVVEWKWVAS